MLWEGSLNKVKLLSQESSCFGAKGWGLMVGGGGGGHIKGTSFADT